MKSVKRTCTVIHRGYNSCVRYMPAIMFFHGSCVRTENVTATLRRCTRCAGSPEKLLVAYRISTENIVKRDRDDVNCMVCELFQIDNKIFSYDGTTARP